MNAAVDGAESCVPSIFSYDYRSFRESFDNGLPCTTGGFRREYRSTMDKLEAAAVREEAVVRAEVREVGVVRATPRRVTVLVFVNQYRRSANLEAEKVDENRVRLTLVPVGGEWLISGAEAI